MHFSLNDNIRGKLPFSAVMRTVRLSKSTSSHLMRHASLILQPVSFSSCNRADMVLLVLAISKSISCSVGMNGIFWTGL